MLFSLFILILFCSTSFLSLSKSLHHSLDSLATALHFHSFAQEVDHHRDSDNSHSDEDNETTVSHSQYIIKNNSHSLNMTLVHFSTPNVKRGE